MEFDTVNIHQVHFNQSASGRLCVSFRRPVDCSYCGKFGVTRYITSGNNKYCLECVDRLRLEFE